MISLLKAIHSTLWETATSLLERRPSFGYFFAAATSSAGLIGLVDMATKIIGLGSVIVGLVVGCYTLRIQKRNWERGDDKK
jgi:TPP-dependent 2-oxoacid decarboxylase